MQGSDILAQLDNPRQLERLYRENKAAFKTAFNALYPQIKENKLAEYWHERLNYPPTVEAVRTGPPADSVVRAGQGAEISWGSRKELILVILSALLAGVIAKLPHILGIDQEAFYERNIGFVVFPILSLYFIWKKGLSVKSLLIALIPVLMAAIFINWLPKSHNSDTLMLACIHLPLFLWAALGFTYVGNNVKDLGARLNFLRYNGDLVIMTGLILIAGGILSGVTIGLFSVIGLHIEKFYFDYIGIFGLAAAPIVATYITQTNPPLVSKISPVIAKIFSPLVLIMLVAYLFAMPFSGKNPYQDREFLLLFNFLLIGVMALILFSVAEIFENNKNRVGAFILLALSVVTIVVNGIALSAILYRISEWGFTPNRLAVMGGNVLMLVHLLMATFQLFKHALKRAETNAIENAISWFLPVYIVWTMVVVFIFPFVFHFR